MKKKLAPGLTLLLLLLLKTTFAANYYWVGGTGDWSDLTHWATASGGSSHPASAPSSADDVFFDALSGFTGGSKTVTLNTTGNCRNMDWTGAVNSPIFALGGTYDLNIYGSLTLIGTMSFTTGCCNRYIYFMGTGTHTVNAAGISFGDRSISFSGSGTYGLSSAITTTQTFYFANGTLNSNNYAINCYKFETSSNSNVRTLSLGSSIITATVSHQTAVNFGGGSNFTFNCGTSQFILNGQGPDFYCYYSGLTFYDISFSQSVDYQCWTSLTANTFHDVVYNGQAYITGGGTFNSLTCNNNYSTDIYSNNTFGTLTINGTNKIITLGAGTTQTVNTSFSINDGTCAQPNTLKSSSTSKCTLNVTSGAEIFAFYKLNYVHFVGGAFTANNTMEDISNSGAVTINMNSASSINYYWVGGSGNWADPTHWATSSGGPGQLSTGCIPSNIDDVFFDANSGFTGGSKTVTINVIANCRNMDWTGAANSPIFAMSNYELNIYGSLTMIATMSTTSSCCGQKINFLGAGTHTVNTAGVTINDRDVYFSGSGTYTLLNAVTLATAASGANFYFTNGTLNTSNYAINCRSFEASGNAYVRTINLGSSVITCSVSHNTAARVNDGSNLTFNAGTSHFILSGEGADLYCYESAITFYDVSFTHANGYQNYTNLTGTTFHNVIYNGQAYIVGGGTFNSLVCNNNHETEIRNNNTFGTLHIFGTGKNIIFGNGTTQTVTTSFDLDDGTCAFPNTLKSLTTAACTLNVSCGAEVFAYYKINYVHVIGGPFTANNTIENISNTGAITINMNSGGSVNFYWVGGTGNWSDPTHWSIIGSGGAAQLSTGCLPGTGDDVFFDANSGFTAGSKTVTLNTTGNCRNMDWTGATNSPIFALGGTYDLNIYGSLTLIATMSFTTGCCTRYIYFMGTGTHTVNSAGVSFGDRNLSFSGTGTYGLSSAITTTQTFYFVNGTLNTNNYAINVYKFATSSNANVRTLNLGSSVITCSYGGMNAASIGGGSNFTFNCGTSHFLLSSSGGGFSSQYSGLTFYNVTCNGAGTPSQFEINNNTFNNVILKGGGTITTYSAGPTGTYNKIATYKSLTFENTSNTTDTLICYDAGASSTYILHSGRTQTVNEYLYIDASGCFPATLRSSTASSSATLSYAGGHTFNGDFLLIRDITASGGATFNAGGNSTDNGGNSGWTWGGTTWTTTVGETSVACVLPASSITLTPPNQSHAESYLWSTGATTYSVNVSAAGTYYCTSTYGINCSQKDTFLVTSTSYAGAISLNFNQTVDTLWQYCRNWAGEVMPDSTTSVVVPSGKRLYIGNNITAYCKNITINAGGSLHIGGGTLRVYGTFENNNSFTHTSDSVIFVSNTTGRIKGTGTTTFYNLYLSKTNATDSIIVTTNPSISNSMNFIKGIAYVNSSNYIQFNSGSTSGSSSANSFVDGKVRKVGATDFIFPVGNRNKWARIGISALGGACTFEASYNKGRYADITNILAPAIDHVSLEEYWILDKVAGTGAKTTLYYEDDNFSGIDTVSATHLRVGHYNSVGPGWEDYGYDAGGMSGSTGWVRSTYQSSFSPETFAAPTLRNSLPIELIQFTATANRHNQVDINWITASEVNNDFFTVEKSKNGSEFNFVNEVKGNGTSSQKNNYSTIDIVPYSGVSYYRLKQTDFDGKYTYSKIAMVDISDKNVEIEMNVFPNPATSQSNINFNLNGVEDEKEILIVLVDVLGKEYYSKTVVKLKGADVYFISSEQLPAGVYFITASSDNKKFSKKIIIQ